MIIAHSPPLHFPNVVHFKSPNLRACTRGSAGALRPLRVLRVVEAGQTSAHAGRLVISGRMADVCAELDRLAAFEHTH
ncbi:hypothetical protein [Rhodoferax sp.]|uniref:hypothetical protein n=1 Tax=Rhodoferax sp. TaxID=50421 RepID=UPI002605F9D8|nr:hypothetical protein [Rhodoferax sp.]MDD2919044.1 hypothetical protein [Rhodoferax sp.]